MTIPLTAPCTLGLKDMSPTSLLIIPKTRTGRGTQQKMFSCRSNQLDKDWGGYERGPTWGQGYCDKDYDVYDNCNREIFLVGKCHHIQDVFHLKISLKLTSTFFFNINHLCKQRKRKRINHLGVRQTALSSSL